MANDDLRFMPAADLAAAIARRKVSPVDAVKAVLDAIDDTKTLNAWVTVDADAALKAARAAERAAMRRGVRHLRTAFRHILPNTVGPFIVLCTAQLGSAILVEATLSFLGMGIPEPYPSWGRMLSVSAAEYAQKAPHLVLFPGIAISLAVFGSNLLGDALRDVLDPRLRGA